RRNAAIRSAAAGIAWDRFLGEVEHHRIAGLARDGLARAGIVIPHEAALRLQRASDAVARKNLVLAAEAVRLQRLFDGARIPALFLKGTPLAVIAYGNLSLKYGWD